MTGRRHRLYISLAIVLALLVAVTVISMRNEGLLPRSQDQDPSSPASTAPESSASPDMEPWEEVLLPGYDDSPDLFELAPLTEDAGEPIEVRLSVSDRAVSTGGHLGLSFDARELANPQWDSTESNLALTLSELDRPVLRFGGNGVDRSMWWTSSGEPAPGWAEVTVTPNDLERVASVAEQIDAQVTIALDLGHDDAARAADMASHARDAFGDRLIAVTVGNEPNGYFHPNQPQLAMRDENWGPGPYQLSLHEYATAIEERAPGLPIAGPGAYDAAWWRAFAESDVTDKAALSLHWYPLWDCAGPQDSIANPTVDDLTSPEIRKRAQHIIGMADDIATEHELPLWIEETGPTSCPGTNETSRTHAQGLWTVDYAMTAAQAGSERTAFHSTLQACQGGAPMSPVCARGPLEDPGEIVAGRTSFLALMQLGWVPDGRVLDSSSSGDGTIVIHGVLADDGVLAVLLVDLRDPADETVAVAPVDIKAPAVADGLAPEGWELKEGSRLTGESLDAQKSSLTALAPLVDATGAPRLGRTEPSRVPSEPGTATLLIYEPISVPATGPEPESGDVGLNDPTRSTDLQHARRGRDE